MTLNLEGLIPATVLPMHADGSIDEDGLRSYISWVADQGPVALAINVDTGEGPHLTHDEKVRVLAGRRRGDRHPDRRRRSPVRRRPPAVRQATRVRARRAPTRFLVFPIPAYLSDPLDVRVPVAVPRGDRRGRAAAHPVPAPARARGAELRARHPAGDGVGRGRRRDQGGIVRRTPIRRHRSPARGPPAPDHAAHRQRQLHPRVVHARRHRRPDRVRRGDDPRAGRR